MVRTAESLREAGVAEALDRGQILLGEQAIHVEDGPNAAELRDALGEWLAAQSWVGVLFDWRNGEAPAGALAPSATWGDRERPRWSTRRRSAIRTPGPRSRMCMARRGARCGFTASMADFARLQGPIVGLNRLTATHGTISPRDQRTVLVLSGEGIRPGTPDHPAAVIDIAPTILALLGLPPCRTPMVARWWSRSPTTRMRRPS
ncbi:MAG: hypothetical protein U0841_18945 [Chloroflexia bacterium]